VLYCISCMLYNFDCEDGLQNHISQFYPFRNSCQLLWNVGRMLHFCSEQLMNLGNDWNLKYFSYSPSQTALPWRSIVLSITVRRRYSVGSVAKASTVKSTYSDMLPLSMSHLTRSPVPCKWKYTYPPDADILDFF